MEILLVNPMPSGSLVPPFPVLPLGLALIAAVAVDSGATVSVISGQNYLEDIATYFKAHSPDLVGMQTFINNLKLCHKLSNWIKVKNPSTTTVLGGVEATNDPNQALACDSVDCIVPGEGEVIFKNLITSLSTDFSKIPGLIFKNRAGQIEKNPGGSIIHELDDLPQIPYWLFYNQDTKLGHILTHRGCPHHCSYCPLKFKAGVSIRTHSVTRIVDSIRLMQKNHGIEYIEFFDENFTMHKEIVAELCRELSHLDIKWKCTARISETSIELLEKMIDAGCDEILFGIGSGVSRLQKVLGTEEDLNYSKYLISQLASQKIKTIAAFSVGIPTETKQEFWQTVDYAMNLKTHEIRIDPAAPLPGTLLYDLATSGGRFLIRNWEDYARPGQLIYLPAGRRYNEFLYSMLYVKSKLHLRRLPSKLKRRFLNG